MSTKGTKNSKSSSRAKPLATCPDCSLDGAPIPLASWGALTPEQLGRIVGDQEPGGVLERSGDYRWIWRQIPVEALRRATEDGEEPDGGWLDAYARYLAHDTQAAKEGTPERAGRAEWIRDHWRHATEIHPLYAVEDAPGELRLWDGYRRLAGAFFHKLPSVWVILGSPAKN